MQKNVNKTASFDSFFNIQHIHLTENQFCWALFVPNYLCWRIFVFRHSDYNKNSFTVHCTHSVNYKNIKINFQKKLFQKEVLLSNWTGIFIALLVSKRYPHFCTVLRTITIEFFHYFNFQSITLYHNFHIQKINNNLYISEKLLMKFFNC